MIKKLQTGVLLLIFLLLPVTTCSAFTHMVSFGDSLSDNGISYLDEHGYFRASNGWVWVDYLAVNLGVTHDGRAWSGATTHATEPDLLWQINDYVSDSLPGMLDSTLFTVWAGGNDLLALLTSTANPAIVIDNAVTNIGNAISILYSNGAKNILVPNMPDLGSIPLAYGDAGATYLSEQFNIALDVVLAGMAMPDLNLYEFDVFTIMNDDIIGGGFFDNTSDPWLGSGGDPSEYLFFDDIHPTTRAHWLLAEYAAQAVPVPSAVWLMGSGLIFLARIRRKG